jgi:hypothetical protein
MIRVPRLQWIETVRLTFPDRAESFNCAVSIAPVSIVPISIVLGDTL